MGERECALCPPGAEVGSVEGPFLTTGNGYAHRECILWVPEVYEGSDGRIRRGEVAFKRARSLSCTICSHRGAGTGCSRQECHRVYHLSCARRSGCALDPGNFRVWCKKHIPAGFSEEPAPWRSLAPGDPRATALLAARRVDHGNEGNDERKKARKKSKARAGAMPLDPLHVREDR